MGIKLDDRYQVEAYEAIQESIKKKGKAGIVLPTGTGKTYLALKLIEDNLDKDQILYVSPSPTINARVRRIIKKEYSKEEAEKILSKIKFTTYNGLNRRYKNSKINMREYNSDMIILDELHRSGAEEWGKAVDYLLEDNQDAQLLGMTATPLRNDGQNMIEKRFGESAYELKISEAVARGILILPIYISSRFIFEEDIQNLQNKIERIENPNKKEEFQNKLNKARKKVAESEGIKEIISKYINEENGKYLLFCNPGDNIEELQELARKEGWFNEVNQNQTFLTVESNQTDAENEVSLRTFLRKKGKDLRLLYSKNMLNEGIHNNNDDDEISGEIMLRPTKSYILFVQQLGRILSKDRAGIPVVLDLVGNIKYFKEFRQEIKSIVEQGIARGDIRYNEKVLEQFKILEAQEDFIKSFEEIENLIENYENTRTIEETLEILEKLKAEGVDVTKIQQTKNTNEKRGVRIVLFEIGDGNIDRIIEKYNLNPDYPIGMRIARILYLYRNTEKLNKKIIERIEELGFEKEKKSSIDETLDILEKLKAEGVDVTKIQQKKNTKEKKGVSIVLSEIDNGNIDEIIEKHNLNSDYPIGKKIMRLIGIYRGRKEEKPLTKEQIIRTKNLGFQKRNSVVSKILNVLEELKEDGVDVSEISKTKTVDGESISIPISDVKSNNIDRIIKAHNITRDYPLGKKIQYVCNAYKGKVNITDDEKSRIENLGLVKEKKSSIEEALDILEQLSDAGIDITKIKQSREMKIDGKRKTRSTYLYEIEDENIEKIITKLGLDRMFPIGGKISNIRKAYKGKLRMTLTDEDRKRSEELKLVNELDKKEAEQNALKQKQEEVRKLKDVVKSQVDKDNIIGGKDEQ